MSLYSIKNLASTSSGGSSGIIAGGRGIYDLYDSAGDMTLTSAYTVSNTTDGSIVVLRCKTLTVNGGGALTTLNRGKGLVVLAESISVASGGSIHMNAKAPMMARGDDIRFSLTDISIPASVEYVSTVLTRAMLLNIIRKERVFLGDTAWWNQMVALGLIASFNMVAGTVLVPAATCGAGGVAVGNPTGATAGTTGSAGQAAAGLARATAGATPSGVALPAAREHPTAAVVVG